MATTDTSTNTSAQPWRREEQWASRVVGFSSEYNTSTWSAQQILGPPLVYPRHGDINGAWAQGHRSNNEFIIVEYEKAVYPEQIDIYETFNPGAVVKVSVQNDKDEFGWETVWETNAPHVQSTSRIFPVSCSNILAREINQIRLDINCSAAGTWCEIDCIKLIGHTSHFGFALKELATNLSQLLTEDWLADVTFQLDNGQLTSSYRNILTVRCVYFAQLFAEYPSNSTESIRISNISYEAFYQILHYIFTDTLEPILTYETCLELMRKADEFCLSPIYSEAFEILKRIMNKNNVLKIFAQSGLFSDDDSPSIVLDDVVRVCVEFVKKNRREVYVNESMQQLTKDMLLQLVQLVL